MPLKKDASRKPQPVRATTRSIRRNGPTAILNGRDVNTLKIAASRMRDRVLKVETGVRHERRHRRPSGPYLVDPLVTIKPTEWKR
jgi:hypothetical protein